MKRCTREAVQEYEILFARFLWLTTSHEHSLERHSPELSTSSSVEVASGTMSPQIIEFTHIQFTHHLVALWGIFLERISGHVPAKVSLLNPVCRIEFTVVHASRQQLQVEVEVKLKLNNITIVASRASPKT